MPGDDPAEDEVQPADEKHHGGNFAGGAADQTDEHIAEGILCGQRLKLAGLHHGKRSRSGDGVHSARRRPAGHLGRIAGNQRRTSGERGVEEVLANAAVELLDDEDREEVADEKHPVRKRRGADHGQQQTGERGGQIADGLGLFEKLAVQPLKEHSAGNGNDGGDQRGHTEYIHGHGKRRHKRDDHIEHQAAGVLIVADMGVGGSDELQTFIIIDHLTLPPSWLLPRPWRFLRRPWPLRQHP